MYFLFNLFAWLLHFFWEWEERILRAETFRRLGNCVQIWLSHFLALDPGWVTPSFNFRVLICQTGLAIHYVAVRKVKWVKICCVLRTDQITNEVSWVVRTIYVRNRKNTSATGWEGSQRGGAKRNISNFRMIPNGSGKQWNTCMQWKHVIRSVLSKILLAD